MVFEKFLHALLKGSVDISKKNGVEFICAEAILYFAIDLKHGIPLSILKFCAADIEGIRDDLCTYLNENFPIGVRKYADDEEPCFSAGLEEVLAEAAESARNAGKKEITFGHFIVAAMGNSKLHASYILKKNGVTLPELEQAVTDVELFGELDDLAEPGEFNEDEDMMPKQNMLEKFAVNLTQLARENKLDALVGRKEELERTIEILSRRSKNNPIHVGDSGVGKTAVTEGLALRIVSGEVPDFLKKAEIYSVEMSSLLAGAKLRGDFESRIKGIIDQVSKDENAILFIDEIHTVMGAGSGGNGGPDAANILKPALAKGNVRCIGSTTFEEYAKHFEKDRALARRFQKIDILEPSRDECIKILKGIVSRYEDFHGVKYNADCLPLAVDLSNQFISSRRLPDKAIDVIDEAGVHAKLHHSKNSGKKTVTVSDIRRAVSKISGVPLESVTAKEKDSLRMLEDNMNSKVFGQKEAVRALSVAVKKARAGFRDLEKPESSFLFVGPTGVGKTELTKVLAETLNEKLLRFDMTEYQESYSLSRLIGSAPGYVGHENGGVLTEAVRKNPHSIILFDEIEKAHEDIYNSLLQVLDYGTLTDSQGRKADFRNCIIIFTSNAGARNLERNSVGFDRGLSAGDESKSVLKEAVEKTFSPEFRNRLDSVIYFMPLDKDVAVDIARKAVSKIVARLEENHVSAKIDDEVYSFIAENGMSRQFGARNINRFAEENVATPLIDELLFGALASGGEISVFVEDGGIKWKKI